MRAIPTHRIREFTEIESAYLAGIIDGEGCITLRPRGRRIFPAVAITNTSPDLICWLQGLCVRRARPLKASLDSRKVHQAWQVEWAAIADVRYLLRRVLPYLIIKRELAQRAVAVLEQR